MHKSLPNFRALFDLKCNRQVVSLNKDLAKSAAEKKDTEEAIAASEAFIEETTAESAATAEEIAELQKEIKALDKAVAEATEQRKEEHADFIVFQQQSNAALQLIDKAKNRLFKSGGVEESSRI